MIKQRRIKRLERALRALVREAQRMDDYSHSASLRHPVGTFMGRVGALKSASDNAQKIL